jgi:Zn-dependent M16 (insulinase) family peptidase
VKDTSFTVGLQNIAPEDVDRVVNIIEDTLASVEAEGFPPERIAAVLHSYELGLKHRSLAVFRPPGSASGSVILFVRIRIFPTAIKKVKKTLDFLTSLRLFILEE